MRLNVIGRCTGTAICAALSAIALIMSPAFAAGAQLATFGAGALLSNRSPQPVFELHVSSPPFYRIRAYTTFSWTDDSPKPTLITAAERSIVSTRAASVGLGGGLLWLDANDYRPYPIIVSSAVVPLGIPRVSAVAIASTQPFQDFEWSLVVKVAVLAWFER